MQNRLKYLLNYLIFNWTFSIFNEQFSKESHTTNWAVLIRADSSAFSLRRVTTFFECEMKISYKEYISESENMESRAETDSKIRELRTCLLFLAYL